MERLVLTAFLLAVAFAGRGAAAEVDVQQTLVYVEDMHCRECAKKIAARLYTVPGVKGVRAVVDHHVAYVTPQASKHPSYKALWEAVESIDFKPVKIAGPLGTFTSKPQQ